MMGMCVGAPIFVGANSPECCCFASAVLIDLELWTSDLFVAVFSAHCTQLAAAPALLCFKNPNEFVTVSKITRTQEPISAIGGERLKHLQHKSPPRLLFSINLLRKEKRRKERTYAEFGRPRPNFLVYLQHCHQ